MGFRQAAPVSGRILRRAAAALAGTAGVTMVFGTGAALASPGSLNTNFASGGNFIHQFGLGSTPESEGAGVTVAPNGDIYQVGSATDPVGSSPPATTDLYIARYLPDGSLDPSFGNDGVAYENVAGSAGATALSSIGPFGADEYVALTPSGNPVVLTDASAPSGTQLAVVEFTQSGQLDPSFGHNGVYEVNVGGTTSSPGGITVTADGTIVFTGNFQSSSSSSEQFFAGALTSSGQVDTSFGTDGLIEPALGSGAGATGEGVVAQSDGDLAFDAYTDGTSAPEIAVVRTDSAGNLDTGFGTAGVAYINDATPVPLTGFAATPDGGYAVASSVLPSSSSTPETSVTRLTATGQPDTAFGTGGTATPSLPSLAVSVPDGLFVQADGKMIITGLGAGGTAIEPEPFIARIDAHGTPDTSFASGGAGLNPVGTTGSLTYALAAAETPDGNAVLSGLTGITTGTSPTQAFLQEVNLDTAPILVTAADANSVQVGTPVTFVAAAVGLDGETLGQPSWDLGSGSFGDATGSTVTKTFTTPGTYTVRAEVTDGFGLSTISSLSITVTAAPANTTPANNAPANTAPASTAPVSTAPVNTAPANVTPAQAVAPTLKLVRISASHGKVKVTLLCAFAACKLNASLTTHAHVAKGKSASLSAGGHGKAITIASSKLALGLNQVHTFTIKLNKAGRKLLAEFKRIPAAASFKLTNTKPAKTIHHRVTVR